MAAGGQGMDPAVVDDIIGRLVEVRSGRAGKQAQLSESEIRQLCLASGDIFLAQPNLLELQAPLKICEMRQAKLRACTNCPSREALRCIVFS